MLEPRALQPILEGQCPVCLGNLSVGLCKPCHIQWTASVSDDRARFTALRMTEEWAVVDLMEWHLHPLTALTYKGK